MVIGWGIAGPILAIGASYVLSWVAGNRSGDLVVGSQAHDIVRSRSRFTTLFGYSFARSPQPDCRHLRPVNPPHASVDSLASSTCVGPREHRPLSARLATGWLNHPTHRISRPRRPPPEVDPDDEPRLGAPSRVQHNAQEAVDAEPGGVRGGRRVVVDHYSHGPRKGEYPAAAFHRAPWVTRTGVRASWHLALPYPAGIGV